MAGPQTTLASHSQLSSASQRVKLLEFLTDCSREQKLVVLHQLIASAPDDLISQTSQLVESKGWFVRAESVWQAMPGHVATLVFKFLDSKTLKFAVESSCRRWRSLSIDGRWWSLNGAQIGLGESYKRASVASIRYLSSRICNIREACLTPSQLISIAARCPHLERVTLHNTSDCGDLLLAALESLPALTYLNLEDMRCDLSSIRSLEKLVRLVAPLDADCLRSWLLPPSLTYIKFYGGHGLAQLRDVHHIHSFELRGYGGVITQKDMCELDRLPFVRTLQHVKLSFLDGQEVRSQENWWPNLAKVNDVEITIWKPNGDVLAQFAKALPNITTLCASVRASLNREKYKHLHHFKRIRTFRERMAETIDTDCLRLLPSTVTALHLEAEEAQQMPVQLDFSVVSNLQSLRVRDRDEPNALSSCGKKDWDTMLQSLTKLRHFSTLELGDGFVLADLERIREQFRSAKPDIDVVRHFDS